MRFYLIIDGGYATANNEPAAQALESVGFRRVSREEYHSMVVRCNRQDIPTTDWKPRPDDHQPVRD